MALCRIASSPCRRTLTSAASAETRRAWAAKAVNASSGVPGGNPNMPVPGTNRVPSTIGGNGNGGNGGNSNGGNVWEADYNANRQGLGVYFWNASGGVYAVFSPNNALSANTWYSVQIQDYQTTTGHAQAWLNGTSLGSVDADLSTSAPYARLMFFDSAPGTIYLDDVTVSNI